MDVNKLKAIIAAYWRYKIQCPLVALEANCRLDSFNDGGQADVLAVNKNGFLIETEIKLNIPDFRRDINKTKHRDFSRNSRVYPTKYFYFAVPKAIGNEVSYLCADIYPYAGVLASDGDDYFGVEVYRQPKLLMGRKLSALQLGRMMKEQSATICRLAEKLTKLNGGKDEYSVDNKNNQ